LEFYYTLQQSLEKAHFAVSCDAVALQRALKVSALRRCLEAAELTLFLLTWCSEAVSARRDPLRRGVHAIEGMLKVKQDEDLIVPRLRGGAVLWRLRQ
jgi:hypothetical protein